MKTINVILLGVALILCVFVTMSLTKGPDKPVKVVKKPSASQVVGGATNMDALTLDTDLTVGDDVIITGDSVSVNGVDTRYSRGVFTDASTTLMGVVNPFSATATVDFLQFDQTGVATSTFAVNCGTSTTAYTASPSGSLIDSATVNTSTYLTIANGDMNAGTKSKASIVVGPSQYVVCGVSGAITTGITGVNNTFHGYYKIRWIR